MTELRRLLKQYKKRGRKQEVLNMGKDPLGCSTSCALTSSSQGDSWPVKIRSTAGVPMSDQGVDGVPLEGVDAQQGEMRKRVECALRGQRKPATLKQSPTSSWEEPHQERLKDINEQWWGCAFDFSVWRLDVR